MPHGSNPIARKKRQKQMAKVTPGGLALDKVQEYSYNKPKKNGLALSLRLKLCILAALTGFLCYSNSLKNGYAIDDIEVLEQNRYVTKGLEGIGELLTTPHLHGFMVAPNETYRPLSLVMFAIEYHFWGANPAMGHFFNLLVFCGCIVALFLFLDQLFGGQKTAIAFLTTVLFAMHPIHTEVVANIKSRDELLCFFFALTSLRFFLRGGEKGKALDLAYGAACLFLSLISKESAISFVAVVPLVSFCYSKMGKQNAFKVTVAALLPAIAFLAVRYAVLLANHNTIAPLSLMDNNIAVASTLGIRLGTAIYVLGNYLKLLVFPYPLSVDYSYNAIPYVNFGNVWVIVSLLLLTALLFTGIFRLVRFKKDPWAFGILFFFITIALFSNLAFFIGAGMAERFLFFPSVGFCLVAALAFEQWIMKTNQLKLDELKTWHALTILTPILMLYGTGTFARNIDWADSDTLFQTDLKKVPNNSRLNYCVGYAYVQGKYKNELNPVEKQRFLAQGIAYLQKSLAICPNYCNAQTELGDAYFMAGQYDSAELHDKMALKINPQAAEAMNNLAGVYFVTGRYGLALELCKNAIKIRSNYAQAHYNIGLCYKNLSQHDSAATYLKNALAMDPSFNLQAGGELINIYQMQHKPDSVRKYTSIQKGGLN